MDLSFQRSLAGQIARRARGIRQRAKQRRRFVGLHSLCCAPFFLIGNRPEEVFDTILFPPRCYKPSIFFSYQNPTPAIHGDPLNSDVSAWINSVEVSSFVSLRASSHRAVWSIFSAGQPSPLHADAPRNSSSSITSRHSFAKLLNVYPLRKFDIQPQRYRLRGGRSSERIHSFHPAYRSCCLNLQGNPQCVYVVCPLVGSCRSA